MNFYVGFFGAGFGFGGDFGSFGDFKGFGGFGGGFGKSSAKADGAGAGVHGGGSRFEFGAIFCAESAP